MLRSGYTTGACAAAAAKAAAELIMRNALCVKSGGNPAFSPQPTAFVEIPFPDGSRAVFKVHASGMRDQGNTAWASVIKDAGDDPDVTNGAAIAAEVTLKYSNELSVTSNYKDSNKLKTNDKDLSLSSDPLLVTRYSSLVTDEVTRHLSLVIKGGKGVGVVTKPGLAMAVGEAAINPAPRRMITEAVMEAVKDSNELKTKDKDSLLVTPHPLLSLEVTISVPEGEVLAKKTLNSRLGIAGGISILGTTGIVRPLSAAAWTATISASMDVARAMGHEEVVLSAGRVSEKAHMRKFSFSEESYVMMGDYLEFSLLEAGRHGFREIHLCAQWAKMLKIAMATPQTHVRHGAIDIRKALKFLEDLGCPLQRADYEFNTAREIFNLINSTFSLQPAAFFSKVCSAAQRYTEGIITGPPVVAHLVSYEGDIIARSE